MMVLQLAASLVTTLASLASKQMLAAVVTLIAIALSQASLLFAYVTIGIMTIMLQSALLAIRHAFDAMVLLARTV